MKCKKMALSTAMLKMGELNKYDKEKK